MAVEWRFYLPPNNYYLLIISLVLVYLHISLNMLKILCAVVLEFIYIFIYINIYKYIGYDDTLLVVSFCFHGIKIKSYCLLHI